MLATDQQTSKYDTSVNEKNKKSIWMAMAQCKCPVCTEGDMFLYPALNFTKFDKMRSHCPNCNFRFEIEPGFFIGAMYISYIMVVALMFFFGLLLFYVFGDPATWVYIVSFPAIVIILLPFIFRFSRVLYLYAFGGVSYKKES